jgi:hypothetical protein
MFCEDDDILGGIAWVFNTTDFVEEDGTLTRVDAREPSPSCASRIASGSEGLPTPARRPSRNRSSHQRPRQR